MIGWQGLHRSAIRIRQLSRSCMQAVYQRRQSRCQSASAVSLSMHANLCTTVTCSEQHCQYMHRHFPAVLHASSMSRLQAAYRHLYDQRCPEMSFVQPIVACCRLPALSSPPLPLPGRKSCWARVLSCSLSLLLAQQHRLPLRSRDTVTLPHTMLQNAAQILPGLPSRPGR